MVVRRCLILLLSSIPAIAIAADEPHWYSLTTPEGEKIGYAKLSQRNTDRGTQIIYRQTLAPARNAGARRSAVRQFTLEKDEAGQTQRLELKSLRTQRHQSLSAAIEDNKAEIVRKTSAGVTRYSLPLPPNVYFDGGDALFETWDFENASILEYQHFNLAAEAVQRVTISPSAPRTSHVFVKKTYDNEALRAVAIIERSETGRISKLMQPFLSSASIKTLTTEADAKAKRKATRTRDLIGIKSPYQISEDALGGTIRYQFAFKHGVTFDVPSTAEQRAISNGDKVFIEICEDCGIEDRLTAEDRQRHLQSTAWLQSTAPSISKAARKIRKSTPDDNAAMIKLGKWARRKLKDVDFAGHYSAKDAIILRRGDCTEDAVLLAALGRAADIPTRVVSGLVYSRERYHGVRDVFVSHSWTQAWVGGRWKSYDIAMERFDAGHIVLAVGDGDPAMIAAGNSLSGFLDLEIMAQVKRSENSNANP